MHQLRDVITRLLSLAEPQGVNRTVLNKLVYFCELESWQRYGRPLTGASFYRFSYGAWAPDVKAVTESLPCVEHKRFLGVYPEHSYRLKGECDFAPLSDEAEEILSLVCAKYSRLTAAYIGRLSKETEPMLAAAEHGDALDFTVAAPRQPRRIRSSRLARAQRELDLAQIGTRDELDRRDVSELAAWAETRRRAAAS